MNNLIYSSEIHNREEKKITAPHEKEKNKINFRKLKKNTCKSLNEVEDFLNNFHRFKNYIKLYKILR